jgi:hypothetical protein
MKKVMTILSLFVFLFISNQNVKSQSLEEALSNLSSSAGSAYVAPVVSAFGSNLNAGWVSGAPAATKFDFTLNVKVVAVGSFFSDEDKTLQASGTFSFTESQIDRLIQNSTTGLQPGSAEYNHLKNFMLENNEWQVSFSGPTIVGSEDDHLQVTFPGQVVEGTTFGEYNLAIDEVKGYVNNLPVLPSVAAQLNVGTLMGTQASFRWFPEMDIQDLGKFSFFGFGILHNPEVWFNDPLPVDIAAGFFTQTMKVGDIFESKATQYGVWISKSFGAIVSVAPFIGFTLETSNTDVAYDYHFTGPTGAARTARVSFELEGKNSAGVTLGAAINLVVLDLTLDYKMSKTNTASVSLSFGM